jgi:hypothetical protein
MPPPRVLFVVGAATLAAAWLWLQRRAKQHSKLQCRLLLKKAGFRGLGVARLGRLHKVQLHLKYLVVNATVHNAVVNLQSQWRAAKAREQRRKRARMRSQGYAHCCRKEGMSLNLMEVVHENALPSPARQQTELGTDKWPVHEEARSELHHGAAIICQKACRRSLAKRQSFAAAMGRQGKGKDRV